MKNLPEKQAPEKYEPGALSNAKDQLFGTYNDLYKAAVSVSTALQAGLAVLPVQLDRLQRTHEKVGTLKKRVSKLQRLAAAANRPLSGKSAATNAVI